MFREAEEPSRNMHPSFRPKPLSTMQLLSQSSKLDDSATHDKITNVDVFHAQQPPTVPCTYDTVYDPSHPDADWSGMVSLKNHHKKHTQNHASQRLGITQCEHGIVAKEERQEWDHRKQPEGSYKNSTTFVIGGINNDEDRFKTEYRRLAHHEATSRDQLTLDKRQKAVRRIPDPAQARTLRDRHQQAQAQYDSAGSILSQSQQQSPRYGYGNGYGDGYGDGETPRSHHQQHQQQQQQQEENSPYCNGQSSQLTRTGSNNNHNMSMSMASGGGGGNNTNYNNTGCNSSSIGNGASYARKSFISDLAGQISAKVEAPKKVVANDSAFSHNRLLVTDNFQPFPASKPNQQNTEVSDPVQFITAMEEVKKLSKQERRNLNKLKRKVQETAGTAVSTTTNVQPAASTSAMKRPSTADDEPKQKKSKAANDSTISVREAETSSSRIIKPASLWNFTVDYNDHFETPPVAYKDIAPMLHALAATMQKSSSDLTIYDPYWCEGSMVAHLCSLGFPKVINKNRDFYADIKKKCIPEYDILVTNPPYSGEHKVNLLKFLAAHTARTSTSDSARSRDDGTSSKACATFSTGSSDTRMDSSNKTCDKSSIEVSTLPFALLLPVYVATKSYWKDFVQQQHSIGKDAFYILPPDYYEYSHPEGTGKDVPPFYSAWFIGGFNINTRARVIEALRTSTRKASNISSNPALKKLSFGTLMVAESVEALVQRGVVTDSKRPNPKQRHKLKAKLK